MSEATLIAIASIAASAIFGAVAAYVAVRVGMATQAARLSTAEGEIDRLREWKHVTVAPYIPRAVDDLKEMLDRHEERIVDLERRHG